MAQLASTWRYDADDDGNDDGSNTSAVCYNTLNTHSILNGKSARATVRNWSSDR